MKGNFIHKKNCRICQSSSLLKVLDLGRMPLANLFLKKRELPKPELKFPLAAYFCQSCGLFQILDVVNPKILFRHYYYLTSTSSPLADHFVASGRELASRFIKSKKDLFVDIGGNDAVLLASLKNKCRVLNVEPAQNIAKISREKGVETMEEFFGSSLAERIFRKYGSAKVVTASNVIAQMDDLKDSFMGVKKIIGQTGVFVLEVHWVANLLGLAGIGGFDQIYHEHLSYFSLTALKKLVEAVGLKIFDVKLIPIHGKSLRVYAAKSRKAAGSVKNFLQKEKDLGLDKAKTYIDFAERVEQNKKELKDLLLKLKKENKKIVGYGAPAKGNILLNYFGIDNKILDFIIDDSPLKQGTYAPGSHIPVFSPARLRENRPDYLLVLAWNYAKSIFEKEKKLHDQGVKFIIPVPKVKIT
ncbi:MAG: class I SAM-dependent methyltransferase [bacterium]